MSEGGKCDGNKLFRWLLRKSKSSRSAREMATQQQALVTTSKSCDTALDAHSTHGVERCPTSLLLWKLLPTPGAVKKADCPHDRNPQLPFRASFSCNDVHGLTAFQGVVSSGSSRDVNAASMPKPSPSRILLQKLSRSTASRLFSAQEAGGSSEDPELLCKLCLNTVHTLAVYTLQSCGCSFCLPCLGQYLLISIREGNVPVTCPDADCPSRGTVLIPEIKEIAGEDAMFMFQRYKLNLDVALDPGRVWCPSPGCETVCPVQPTATRPHLVTCHNCRLKFCSGCKLPWHGKMTACSDARKSLTHDRDTIKYCPSCRIPIEKEDGCAQMMCYRCRHVFCWHCLASLDDDFLLRHYDKGPCRNKLGHSRASIIWHRTQVVGIFAGFSLLLLLASPFLLLAAPCLLCCRQQQQQHPQAL